MPTAALTVLILALALAGLTACGQSETPTEPRAEVTPLADVPPEEPPEDIEALIDSAPISGSFSFEAYAYDCDGQQVTVRAGDNELAVILPERELLLPQVEAASGARYVDGDDGFWGKGIDSAVLTLAGEDIPCVLDRRETPWVDARARGVLLRGFGLEPGWHVDIHAERIVVVYQYGRRRVVTPNPGVTHDPDRPIRRWQVTTEDNELLVEVEERGCSDTMSDSTFPLTVAIVLDGRNYAGCGRDLD